MSNWDHVNFGPQGWVCPKCGRVYSPFTSMCNYCNGESRTFANSTNVTTFLQDDDWLEAYRHTLRGVEEKEKEK